jgi:hypothetical protein
MTMIVDGVQDEQDSAEVVWQGEPQHCCWQQWQIVDEQRHGFGLLRIR